MTTSKRVSATQKKKRLLQLRDAQRRRRERLKGDSQHFVQIILPEKVLVELRGMVGQTGETLQHIIGRLVEESLAKMQPVFCPAEKVNPEKSTKETDQTKVSDAEENSFVPQLVNGDEESLPDKKGVNQLDLFG